MTDPDLLAALLPEGVVSVCGVPEQDAEGLRALGPSERAAIEGVVPSRGNEFVTGRMLARRALARLGVTVEAIDRGPEGAPVWPPGIVGSITHTRRLCAVAVARAQDFAGIGIDAEPDEALPTEILDEVTRPSERDWLATLPEGERGPTARLVFAIKECVYKAQYPIARRFLDFPDVEVTTPIGEDGWSASILAAGTPSQVSGRWARAQGHWLTTCVLAVR